MGFVIGSFACVSSVAERPSQNCVAPNIALRIVGAFRWPFWFFTPIEVSL